MLAATFAALGVLPILFLAQIAFIVAFGVLLDTTVVRSLFVPSVSYLLGAKIWSAEQARDVHGSRWARTRPSPSPSRSRPRADLRGPPACTPSARLHALCRFRTAPDRQKPCNLAQPVQAPLGRAAGDSARGQPPRLDALLDGAARSSRRTT